MPANHQAFERGAVTLASAAVIQTQEQFLRGWSDTHYEQVLAAAGMLARVVSWGFWHGAGETVYSIEIHNPEQPGHWIPVGGRIPECCLLDPVLHPHHPDGLSDEERFTAAEVYQIGFRLADENGSAAGWAEIVDRATQLLMWCAHSQHAKALAAAVEKVSQIRCQAGFQLRYEFQPPQRGVGNLDASIRR